MTTEAGAAQLGDEVQALKVFLPRLLITRLNDMVRITGLSKRTFIRVAVARLLLENGFLTREEADSISMTPTSGINNNKQKKKDNQ
jgi:hypothetical protein